MDARITALPANGAGDIKRGIKMTDSLSEQVLNLFLLNDLQRSAAIERGRDVAVTAGAGSGKTRTLVARYACLLA